MDSIDRAIVKQLQADSALSNTTLADRVGLTPSPCLRRVRRLEEERVILGYHARISAEALGQGFEVFVEFELDNQTQATIERFETALVAYDEVLEARRMFGAPDVEALVAVADLESYERFMTRHLSTLPGLVRMQSRFAMKTLKNRHEAH